MILDDSYIWDYDDYDVLEHVGTKRHSGRYEWGSGEVPYQHEPWFTWLQEVNKYREEGMTDTEIARAMGMSTTEFRERISVSKNQKRAADSARAFELKEKGYSNTEIGRRMGINESSVRALLNPHYKVRNEILNATADVLRKNVNEKGFIDVGAGTELYLGVTQTKLKAALASLKDEGYEVHNIYVEQATNPGKKTTVKVLCPPGTKPSDIYKNLDQIHLVEEHSNDMGLTWYGLRKPESLDSSRMMIRYAEDGGVDKDGVIELRRGVDDISLGDSTYAQVRIAVDGTHYLKGMAMYSDNMPDGVDVIFNTNKHTGTPMEDVLKPLKDDPNNPFGAAIKTSGVVNGLLAGGQREYIDANGDIRLSVINKVNEEGDWGKWSKTLASQMLSKQPVALAEKQLNLSYLDKREELDDILSLTNPEVKKVLLSSFAEDCDSAAVDLKAAAMPRQASHVILPINSLPDNEIYAPKYRDGETVVLIRYPHGGKFEIPQLTVNNRNPEAKNLLGNAVDAVGINSNVAGRLSGADFDGDTVLVIPNNYGEIKTSPPLKDLEKFDPKEAYPYYEGMKVISARAKQNEMGKVSNLITDMTLKGASDSEIARAVKHSMVVIDAEKHKLNYKQSYEDNRIAELKEKYQGGKDKGASTLISKASSDIRVPERSDYFDIDKETGEKIYKETGRTYTKVDKKTGEIISEKSYLTKSTKMAEAKDARELSSGTQMENIYADYANKLKAMANEARKEMVNTKPSVISSSAKKTYAEEVASLNAKLNIALKNAPLERQAQVIASYRINQIIFDNPDLADKNNEDSKKELKRIKQQTISQARASLGASSRKDRDISITPKEWEAIQAGAISSTQLMKILNNTNLDTIREYATPKDKPAMPESAIAKARILLDSGNTLADVADVLGVSTSTLVKSLED